MLALSKWLVPYEFSINKSNIRMNHIFWGYFICFFSSSNYRYSYFVIFIVNCSYVDLPISSSSSTGLIWDSPNAGVWSPEMLGTLPRGFNLTTYEVGFFVGGGGPSFFGKPLFNTLGYWILVLLIVVSTFLPFSALFMVLLSCFLRLLC